MPKLRSPDLPPPVPHHKWTEEERDHVRNNYQGTHRSRDAIAATLNVSTFAVAGQIAKMGIAKSSDRRPWTSEEEDKLRELVPEHSPVRIAKKMRRSVNAITVRIKRLGLHRRDHTGWFTMREVCDIVGKDHKWVRRRIESGTLRAERHTATEAQADKLMWHIKARNLRDFLRRYPQDLDGRNVDLITVVDLLVGLLSPHNAGDINLTPDGPLHRAIESSASHSCGQAQH